ncbi:MAG TPA: hypothetical protein VFP34_16645 [Microlunatus sp.]|nr:hypothetical protein [Microlunatus sp.]
MITRRIAGLALAGVLGVTGACGSEQAPNPPASGSTSPSLQPYEKPPARVPVARIGTTVLAPAQYAWRVDGTYRQHQPSSDGDVASTTLDTPAGSELAFALATTVRPAQTTVIVYDRTDTPVPEGPGTRVTCGDGPECTLDPRNDMMEVVLHRFVPAPALVVLDVQYPTFEPVDREEGVATYGASWVARLR